MTRPDRRPRRVAICVATFNRPYGLRRLLRSIARQRFHHHDRPRIEVVIVDNSPVGVEVSAQEELAAIAGEPLRVLHEPRRGIPFARNAAVRAAVNENDFLAFVDDDKALSDSWLDELLATVDSYGADAVCGPTVQFFASEPRTWMRGLLVEKRRPSPTGTLVEVCYTGNVLVRSELFSQLSPWFDERLALSGGEDSEFFRRAARSGYRLVHTAEAITWAFLPPHRLTLRWDLRFRFRVGQNEAQTMRHAGASTRRFVRYWFGSLFRLAQGSLVAVVRLPQDRDMALRALRNMTTALGRLYGAMGQVYEPYRKPRPEALADHWYCLPEDQEIVRKLWTTDLAGQVTVLDSSGSTGR